MSYQQTTNHADTSIQTRSTSGMYAQPQTQGRSQRDSQGPTTSFTQASITSSQAETAAMNAMMNQFTGLTLPSNMTPTTTLGAAQLAGGSQYFYNPADNTYLVAPAVYPQQTLGQTQHAENAYNSYTTALPYFGQGAAYPGYMPGFPLMPYTPNRVAGYYHDRAEHIYKEVPGLENRRGSYSTNESAPGTPHYGLMSQREQGTHIAAVDRSPFGSTPSPQQFPAQHADQQGVKPLPYKTIPINVDIDALLMKHPAIPRAVPAVFTPRENMRTLDQSLSNPIPGNRNVYIRGLHPDTDDETLAAYAARFGKIETSKAIIDTATGACKG